MKYLTLITISLLVLISCKEKETYVDPCTNGYLDPGEVKIDCGGTCTPCPTVYIPSVNIKLNGVQMSFPTKTLSYSSNLYLLTFSNDTMNFQLNLGSNDSVNTYVMSSNQTFAQINSTHYTGVSNATFAISANDKTNKRMNGFFNLTYFVPGQNDTLKITSGQFSDLNY